MTYPQVKRLFDIVFAATALVVATPVIILIASSVLLLDGPPVLFEGKRMGVGGEEFGMYKFRTMRLGTDHTGPRVTAARDARITPLGRFLRNWKLDELPQLINVMRGEMSVVGPRPEDPQYLPCYREEQRHVLDVRPGITGITQVMYRDEERLLTGANVELQYQTEVLPTKLDLDLSYVRNVSFRTDMRLLVLTLRGILFGRGRRTNII